MAKKKEKGRGGPRVIPAHWRRPDVPATATATALAGESPASWPLGPCWATRTDNVGSQAVFLSRQRPWGGSLTVVGAVLNEVRGIVDGMGDHAIGQARLHERLVEMGRPSQQVYTVPPEYVRFRMHQGEEVSERSGRDLPVAYRKWRLLLEGIDPDWTPDFAALEEKLHQPDLLERTGVLVHAAEFSDWRAAPDDDPAVTAFLDAVDGALAGMPDRGHAEPSEDAMPPDLDLLEETHFLAALWPLTEAATQQMKALVEEHLEKVIPREAADRYRERLLHMAYLTDRAGQPGYSGLIATAAWGLSPEREAPLSQNPFLRALMRQTVERHVLGFE